jgi:cobalt-zinc-cadmium efflux system outer membrane protein
MQRLFIVGLLVVVVLPVHVASSITMDEAVRISTSQNPQLNSLRLEQGAARGQIERARLPLIANPVIEGLGSMKEKSVQDGRGKYTNYGVAVSQEFEVAGQRGLRIDIAEKNYARVGLEIQDRHRILIYDVKTSFANALVSKQRVTLSREVMRLQEELLEFTRARLKAGEVSGLEVTLAEVEYSKACKDVLSAQREYSESLSALQGLMGTLSPMLTDVEGELLPEIISIPQKESLENILFQRPDVRAASVEADRTKRVEKLAARQAIPNLIFGGFYSRDEWRDETGAILAVAIPLFDRKQGERTEAKARAAQAQIGKVGLERDATRQFERDYNNLLSSQRELSLFRRDIVDKSAKNLELLYLAFKEGKISFYDVRVAQRETIELQFAYLDSLFKAQQSIYAIERTIGGTLK